MNPTYRVFGVRTRPQEKDIKTIPEEKWCSIREISYKCRFKTWPTIGGFSFAVKKWGEVIIDATKGNIPVNFLKVFDIIFDDRAFEKLVLPEKKKRLIKALVLHSEHSFHDIISGKGQVSAILYPI